MKRIALAVKKDFILEKMYLLYMAPVAILIPIFINENLEGLAGSLLAYLLGQFFVIHIIFNNLAILEDGSNGRNTLVVAPYCRDSIIIGRYLFLFLIFIINTAIYAFISFLTNLLDIYPLEGLTVIKVAITSLFLFLWMALNLGLYYKMGSKKMRFLSHLLIFSSPFILPIIVKKLGSLNLADKLNFKGIWHLLIAFGLLLYALSYLYSQRVFQKRDL